MENSSPKILAIDDNQDNLLILKALINDLIPDCIILTAANARAGIDLARSQDPDMILLDILMPGLDGFETCGILKSDEATADIPVVFLTALRSSSKDIRMKALKAGAEGFISKPVDEIELTAQIHSMIKIKAANRKKQAENIKLNEIVGIKTAELRQELDRRYEYEKKLKQSEEKFQLLFDKAPLGYQSLDSEGRLLEVNQQWLDTFGYEKSEVVGKFFGDFLAPDYLDHFLERFPVFKQTGSAHSEFELVCKDGKKLHIAFEGKTAQNPDGSFRQTHCILQDITLRKQAEAALMAERDKNQLYLDTVNTIIISLTPDGTVTMINNYGLELLGYEKHELVGKSWFDTVLYALPEKEAVRDALYDIISNESSIYLDYENDVITKSGEAKTIVWKNKCLRDRASNCTGILSSGMDITERKHAETLIEEGRHFTETILESIPIPIFYKDLSGRYLGFNKAFTDFFGKSKNDMLGKNAYDIAPPALADVYHKKDKEVVESKGIQIYESQVQNSAGKIRDVLFHKTCMTDIDGNVSGIIGAILDITERKKLESDLVKERNLLDTILKSVSDAVISCDADGSISFVNKAASVLTGFEHDILIGHKYSEILDIRIASDSIDDLVLIASDGAAKPVEVSSDPIITDNGNITGSVFVIRDYTEKKQRQDELIHLSYHDQLTGLYNRRFFEEELKRLDTPRNLPLTIIMGDVNGLKLINDSFGYATCDLLLKKASQVIRNGCRSDDIVARLGGDEFVILLPKTDTKKAEMIISRVYELSTIEHFESISISISFGYDTKDSPEEKINDILKSAEDSMYKHKLYESLSMRSKTIDLIINTLFEKSNREMLHSKRVSSICEAIADKLNLSSAEVNDLRIAGLMHDIGKIGIDETILDSPGKLDDDGWEEMKRHPEIGYRILSSVNEFSEMASYILQHHERLDGKGYPKGLKGDQIPLRARIIAIADAYDAMTSNRSYREALSEDNAIKEIIKHSGTQFDPEIARVFVEKVLGQSWEI